MEKLEIYLEDGKEIIATQEQVERALDTNDTKTIDWLLYHKDYSAFRNYSGVDALKYWCNNNTNEEFIMNSINETLGTHYEFTDKYKDKLYNFITYKPEADFKDSVTGDYLEMKTYNVTRIEDYIYDCDCLREKQPINQELYGAKYVVLVCNGNTFDKYTVFNVLTGEQVVTVYFTDEVKLKYKPITNYMKKHGK